MNDYYSDFPQPDLNTRVDAAIEKVPEHLQISISKQEIMLEATKVCKESRDFSLPGWTTWGHKDEVSRLVKVLDDLNVNQKV